MKKIFMFPGQGSQKVGMAGDLFQKFPEYVVKANNILGYDLEALCSKDLNGQINQTQFTQPALYVVNALSSLSLEEKPIATVGHSLGEYNALLQAEVFDFETGLKLVQKRGELMSQATGGGMAAILGLDTDSVREEVSKINNSIEIANYNSPLQTVVSGSKEDIIQAQVIFEEAGARRYVVLPTSGAFHSKQMKSSQDEFSSFVDNFEFREPKIPVVANVNAQLYGSDIKSLLISQISSSVYWVDSILKLLQEFSQSEFIEVGPGKVLTGLLRQIKK